MIEYITDSDFWYGGRRSNLGVSKNDGNNGPRKDVQKKLEENKVAKIWQDQAQTIVGMSVSGAKILL